MGKRREARERAVQFLFQNDLNPPENLQQALDEFWSSQRAAAIAEDKSGKASWGEKPELPPPTADAASSRQVLCAAAGAAAVQAVDHDRRVRPLFPDRPVFPG